MNRFLQVNSGSFIHGEYEENSEHKDGNGKGEKVATPRKATTAEKSFELKRVFRFPSKVFKKSTEGRILILSFQKINFRDTPRLIAGMVTSTD